jgi:Protein of unknown function (DUF4011)
MSFTQPGAAGAPELGVADDNGAIVEMVRHGIQKAREKVIDLSLRNGMLNYRHSESSSRHVRVVHQLPSAVVECLASEKSIDLIPLPPVETIPRDEDADVFREALREAKAVDPEWLAAEDAKRAAGSRRRSNKRLRASRLIGRAGTPRGRPRRRSRQATRRHGGAVMTAAVQVTEEIAAKLIKARAERTPPGTTCVSVIKRRWSGVTRRRGGALARPASTRSIRPGRSPASSVRPPTRGATRS